MRAEELKRKYGEYLRSLGKGQADRPFVDKAIEAAEEAADGREHLVVSAPTGYGKSAVSMYLAQRAAEGDMKLIVAYPTRALIEEQLRRVRGFLGFAGPGLESLARARYMGVRESPFLIYPVTLTTLETLSLASLGLPPEEAGRVFREGSPYPHYLFSRSSVMTSTMLLDEAHLLFDSSKKLSYLLFLMKEAKKFGSSAFMMSATMPGSFTGALSSAGARVLKFSCEDDEAFCKERKGKEYPVEVRRDVRSPVQEVKGFLERGFKRALVVFNTVEGAVEFYRAWRGLGRSAVLVHSRFDQEDKERKLRDLEGMDEGVVVGTQSVEVGIDMSFDVLATEAAPLNSLVQRFGRFLRGEGEASGRSLIWARPFDGDLYDGVYDAALVKESLRVVEERLARDGRVNLHVGYEDMLNSVYGSEWAGDPSVENLIRDFEWAFLELATPERAAALLVELEGSYVADSIVVDGIAQAADGERHVPVELSLARKHVKGLRPSWSPGCADRKHLMAALMGCSFVLDMRYDPELGLVGDLG